MRRKAFKSRRALVAEAAGLMTLTALVTWLRTQQLPSWLPRNSLKEFIETFVASAEWHHAGWAARQTDYYDAREVLAYLTSEEAADDYAWFAADNGDV